MSADIPHAVAPWRVLFRACWRRGASIEIGWSHLKSLEKGGLIKLWGQIRPKRKAEIGLLPEIVTHENTVAGYFFKGWMCRHDLRVRRKSRFADDRER
jgi:hypothetical protein